MGCFFTACFGSCKHTHTLKNDQQQDLSCSRATVKLLDALSDVKEDEIADPIKLISESETPKNEDHMDYGWKAVFDCSNEDSAENGNGKSAEKKIEKCKEEIIGEECLAMKIPGVTLEDNAKENGHCVQLESSESLFSLSIDSRKHVYALEVGEKEEVNSTPVKASDRESTLLGPERIIDVDSDRKEKTLSSRPESVVGVKDDERENNLFGPKRIVDVDSDRKEKTLSGPESVGGVKDDEKENILLGPLTNVDLNLEGKENLLFRKKFVDLLVQPLGNSSLKYHEDKENLKVEGKCNGPVKKQAGPMSDLTKPSIDKDMGADCTSLSSWLAESEKSPHKGTSGGNSPGSEKNYGNRRVLGAINLKEMNDWCCDEPALTCSGDDQPGIGTVGKYWQQTGLNGPVLDTGLSSGLASFCRGKSNVLTV